MIDIKSLTDDEKKVLDVILDKLAKPMAEETNIPISEARESIISLIEKEFVKIVYKKIRRDLGLA